jgi:hypothetical protein
MKFVSSTERAASTSFLGALKSLLMMKRQLRAKHITLILKAASLIHNRLIRLMSAEFLKRPGLIKKSAGCLPPPLIGPLSSIAKFIVKTYQPIL